MTEPYLEHYGIPGMKWGVRKKRNPNYSDDQFKRDRIVYGRRGANRINKNMNRGDSVSTARSMEKTRRDRVMGKNKYYRQGGKLVGGAVSGGVGMLAYSFIKKKANTPAGRQFANKIFGDQGGQAIAYLNNPTVQGSIVAGSAYAGYLVSGDLGVAANMRAHGYDPYRKK